jgi:hypothetical protein
MLDRYGAPLVGAVCAIAMIVGEKKVRPHSNTRRALLNVSEEIAQYKSNIKLQ